MNTWISYELGDCLKLLSGGTPSKSKNEYWSGDIPWVSCKDMKVSRIYDSADHLTRLGASNGTRLVAENTILFVVRGMILAKEFPVALTKCSVAFNQDLKAAIPSKCIDTEFLFHWFRANSYEVLGRVDEAGHGTKRLQTDRLLSMQIHVPSISTQKRIAGILSAYDELIENNQRRIRILEDMARSLYREWFVHFRYPGHEAVPLVDSSLGPIPEGWEIRFIKDIATVTFGFAFKSRQFNTTEIGTPIVRIRDVRKGKSGTYTEEVAGSKYHIKNGDILVGMDGDFHMCIWSNGHAYQNQRVARFNSQGEVGGYHLFLALEKPIQNFNKAIVGTTVAHLGDMHIKTIQIAWPTIKLLNKAKATLEPMSDQIIAMKKKIQVLKQSRDLLLPKLLSGQINLEEIKQ